MMLKSTFFAELKHSILRELSEHVICYIGHCFTDFWVSKSGIDYLWPPGFSETTTVPMSGPC